MIDKIICKRIIFSLALFFFFALPLLAQEKEISGKVIDSKGNPIEGVAVIEKGTTNGVLTSSDGTWTLKVSKDAIVVFSCIGWETYELSSNNVEIKSISMTEENLMIDGTVVIGYGTIRRSTLANSVTTVRADDFVKGAVASPLQMLQGKVAGLSVTTSSGDPNGSNVQMMLRGVSTLMSDQEPLIVIDGIAGGSMNNVTQDDILTIDVLKDGAAAAIYGTKGNNGVILITTKRGIQEKSSINYHGYASVESISNKIDVFSAEEYRNLKEITNNAFTPLDGGENTNWEKEAFRVAINHYHNLSINGGNDNSNYYANISYNSRQGIIRGSGLDKLNISAGINQSFFDKKLKISANVSNIYASGSQVSEEDAYLSALICNPTLPVYNKMTGDYQTFADVMNTARCVNEFREDVNWDEIAGTGKISYSPIEGLTLNAVGGMKYFFHLNGAYATKNFDNTGKGGMAWRNTSLAKTYNGELYANYSKQINKHDFNAVLGYSYYSYNNQSLNTYNYDFPTDEFEYNNMGLGLALKNGNATMGSDRSMNKLISFFSRVNYSYDQKYIVALSIRGDGSSKFGPNNRWGAFWSGSAAWRISQEEFMQSADWLDELKLKFSYGVTGVEPVSPYLSQMRYTYSNPVFMDGKYIWTISPSAVANPNLKWEEKHEYNIGVDFSMFKSRFSGSLDFYIRNTKDLLYSYNVPMPPNLASTIYANVGSISNKGIELTLSGQAVQTQDFNLNISGNFAINDNRIISLSNEYYQRDFMEVGNTGAPVQKTTHLVKEGGRVGDFYGWESTGIKKNGAWICEGGSYGSESARKIIGNGIPKLHAGLSVNMAYKAFDLSFSLRGAFLYQILNQYRMLRETWQKGQMYNYPKSILEKPYGGEYSISASTAPSYVSYYVEDGDFMKLDNVTLGYNFKFKENCAISTLRLYLSGLNLYTLTKYKGIDPEVNFSGLAPGIDYMSRYPTTRTISFGVKLGF